jgi:hypothetical protein
MKPVPNVTRLADLTTTIIICWTLERSRLAGNAWQTANRSAALIQLPSSKFRRNRLRVLVGGKTLLGAIVMGDQTLSQAVHRLIAQQVDIAPVRQKLLHPDMPLADIIADFYTQWKEQNDQTQQP